MVLLNQINGSPHILNVIGNYVPLLHMKIYLMSFHKRTFMETFMETQIGLIQ